MINFFLLLCHLIAFLGAALEANEIVASKCLVTRSPHIIYDVLSERSDHYDDLRVGENFRYQHYFPLIIVSVSSVRDIRAAVLCGKEYNLKLSVRNGGHSSESLSQDVSYGILIQLDDFSRVISIYANIEKNERYLKVQSGMRLGKSNKICR